MKFGNYLKGAPVAAILISGCASIPTPTEEISKSQAAIRAAEEVGANEAPEAELHLKLAREQLEEARRLAEEGDNRRAKMLVARSEADAELAIALARESTMRSDAQETLNQLNQLQQALP